MTTGNLLLNNFPRAGGISVPPSPSVHLQLTNYAVCSGPASEGLPNLKGKRVGIIGTGATAVQCIPNLAKNAEHLYVFQRTPSSIDIRDDKAWEKEDWLSHRASFAERNGGKGGQGFTADRRVFFDKATAGGFLHGEVVSLLSDDEDADEGGTEDGSRSAPIDVEALQEILLGRVLAAAAEGPRPPAKRIKIEAAKA